MAEGVNLCIVAAIVAIYPKGREDPAVVNQSNAGGITRCDVNLVKGGVILVVGAPVLVGET